MNRISDIHLPRQFYEILVWPYLTESQRDCSLNSESHLCLGEAIVNENRVRVRINRSTGELEVEGTEQQVTAWWEKLWPQLSNAPTPTAPSNLMQPLALAHSGGNHDLPEIFGEYYSEFRSDVTDVDRVLIAGSFVQARDSERVFTTKGANQLLLDQNIKVTNASENVRRLTQTKRVFVVSDGRFRVSTIGIEHLKTLRTPQ
jgi:hypothetical protein